MRRFAVVAFAVVASTLVVSAPVGAATSVEVVSIHNTDTDFNAASELTDAEVEGSGTDAKVVFGTTTTIDDFEDDDIAEYSGDTGQFQTASSPAFGTRSLEGDGGGSVGAITRTDVTTEQGANYTYRQNISTGAAGFVFGVDAATGESSLSGYFIEVRNDQVTLYEVTSGTYTSIGSDSASIPTNEWLTGEVVWNEDDTINVTIDNEAGTEVATVDASDSTYSSGGIGFRVGATANHYWDNIENASEADGEGTYISQTHSVDNAQNGFTNLTLTNVSAEVTWLADTDGDGTFETTAASGTFTTTDNHSLDISGTDSTDWRVNVTTTSTGSDPTAELHDEGIEATVHDPEFDNSTASPDDEQLATSSPTLEIQLNDSDFPTAQGDSVTVEFFSNKTSESGTSEGADTLTSNGTASVTADFTTGGAIKWWANATDGYGLTNRSANFTVTVPSNISIREESPDHPLIDSGTVEIMFFEQEDDNPTIVNRSVNDGNVSLEGLPIGSTFVMTAKIGGYYNRTVIVDDIFTQDTIFLINQSVEARQVTFTIDDDTGVFTGSDTEIFIQHAINESIYNSGDFTWLDVAGEETGAIDSVTFWMAWEERYRIKVRAEGDTRILGAFTPVVNETITLRPATPDINVTDEQGYAWNVTAPEDGSEVVFEFNDPDDDTTDLRLRIYEQGNESNEIYDQTHAGPHGYLKVTQPLTGDQVNQTWTVDWNATRQSETIGGERTAGRQVIDQIPQLDTVWQHAIAVLAVILTGALFSARNVETGAMTTAFVGGGFWMAGWLPTAAGGAITVAIFIVLAYKVSTRRVT